MQAVKDYNGPRESAGIVDHALQTLEAAGVPIKIPELNSQKLFDTLCGTGKICAIAFLPHIYDSSAKDRNAYIGTIADAAKTLRGTPMSFFWSEAGAQLNIENALGINNAYPTLAVISMERKVFVVQKVSWNQKNIKNFLSGVMSGRYVLTFLSIISHYFLSFLFTTDFISDFLISSFKLLLFISPPCLSYLFFHLPLCHSVLFSFTTSHCTALH